MTACAALPDSPALAPINMMNAVDTTMGRITREQKDNLLLVTITNAVHAELVQGESIRRDGHLPPRYAQFLARLAKHYKIKRVADWPLAALGIRCLVFKTSDQYTRYAVIAGLSKEPEVESAQALQYFHTLSNDPADVDSTKKRPPPKSEYNDPYYTMQHGFYSMQIQDTHHRATGKGVRIAVIDTGVDHQHVDLASHIIDQQNFVDRNTKAFNSDVHGTAITGVIAATANNNEGMVGIAPDASIIALKACWQSQATENSASCSSFTLAKALNFAIKQQVDIINLSLAGPQDPLLARLIHTATDNGVLIVGAVNPRKTDDFPAYIDNVIAVAESEQSYSGVDMNAFIRAPGEKVLSASPGDHYDFYSGSSLSTAHITGLAALLRQHKPQLSATAIKNLLTATAEPDTGAANACHAISRIVVGSAC